MTATRQPPLLLASGSRYKKAQLARLGLPFEVQAADVDETPVAAHSPRDNALRLAADKALALASAFPEHLIIGADQVLAFENQILHKPGTPARTLAQLQQLRGKCHTLHTAVYLLCSARGWRQSFCVDAHLTFYADLSDAWLKAMIAADESSDCVGGYKYESRGIALMEKVETSDPNAIVGLPLLALTARLRAWGYFAADAD